MNPNTVCKFHVPIRVDHKPNEAGVSIKRIDKRHKREKSLAYQVMPVVPLPIIVRFTRISAGTLDDDAVGPALKSIRDGIALKLSVPDNDPRIKWEYAQAKGKRGKYGVDVEVVAWDVK